MNVSPAWSGDQPQKAIYSATKKDHHFFSTTQEWIKIQNWHASLISWETVNSKIQHKPILGLFSQFSLSYLAVGALYYYIIPLIRQVYSRHFFLLVNTCTICILYIDIYIYIDIHTYIHPCIHTYIPMCIISDWSRQLPITTNSIPDPSGYRYTPQPSEQSVQHKSFTRRRVTFATGI